MNDRNFSKRLKYALAQRGLSQIEAAQLLSINKDSLSNYAKGRLPRADILLKIAHLCNVSCDWLLTGNGPGPGQLLDKDYSFAERLKSAITHANLSKEQVSERLNFSNDRLDRYLGGEIPNSKSLLILARLLGISMEWLLTGEEFLSPNRGKESDLNPDFIKGVISGLDLISENFSQSMQHSVEQIKDIIKEKLT